MKKHDLTKIGVPNSALDLAVEYISAIARSGLLRRYKPRELIEMILDNPQNYFTDSLAGRFAKSVAADNRLIAKGPAPYKVWGENLIDLNAIEQMRTAVQIPVAIKGAMMPDAHLGYGLPCGGVLATINAVVPFFVGVDIGCRMQLSVFDVPDTDLEKYRDRIRKAIDDETNFGIGGTWDKKREHTIMDRDWGITETTKQLKDVAWSQLGTSGSGNHYCDIGIVEFSQPIEQFEAGHKAIALMTHSGSRRPGSRVCDVYSKIAIKQLSQKYSWAKHAAWLYLDKEEGIEYWNAMQLMGDYASANHDCIHRHVSGHLGFRRAWTVQNWHNYAWKEIHDGIEVVVHRKGATPAGKGVLGVISGSMADPAYIVRGTGNPDSLDSAAHGAGRKYGRSAAKQAFNWEYWHKELKNRGVELISAGLDEVPGAYKDVRQVMASQADLIEIIAQFDPKIVKMAGAGPSED